MVSHMVSTGFGGFQQFFHKNEKYAKWVYVCMNMHKEMNKMNIHFCAYIHFQKFRGECDISTAKNTDNTAKTKQISVNCTQNANLKKH